MGRDIAVVTGASGDQGRAQVARLTSAGYRVRAAVRNPSRIAGVLPAGAEAVAFDFRDPATLDSALAGADVVFMNFPSASFNPGPELVEGFAGTLARIERTGPDRVVFNASLYVGERPNGFTAHDTRLAMIEALARTRLSYVALCPVLFMDNLLKDWALPSIRARQVVRYPLARETRASWICLDDVAALAQAAAEVPRLSRERLVVGGPEALTGDETAAALSRALGTPCAFESLDVPTFAAEMATLFAPKTGVDAATIADALVRVYTWYNTALERPFQVDMAPVLARLPVTLTPLEDWARGQDFGVGRSG